MQTLEVPKQRMLERGSSRVEIDGEITSAFTCPVCLSFFKKPKILPGCGHSICLFCAQEILKASKGQKNSLICPECRFENNLGIMGLEGLKTNFSIQRAIEIFGSERSARKIGKIGECCPHQDRLTKQCTTCKHCNGKFCNACLGSHLERLKFEACWIVSDFESRLDAASNSVGPSSKQRKSTLNAEAEKVSGDINAKCDELVAALTDAVEDCRRKLLADLENYKETQLAKFDSRFDDVSLKQQIETTLKSVKQLLNTSPLYLTANRVVPVYEQSIRVDKDLQNFENGHCGAFDKIELESNSSKCSVDDILLQIKELYSLKQTPVVGDILVPDSADAPTELLKFRNAVTSGDFEAVKEILQRPLLTTDCRRFIIDHRDDSYHGYTTLLHAAEKGHLDIVKYLVQEYEADVYVRNKESEQLSAAMPIHWAAQNGHIAVVKFLLEVDPEQLYENCGNGSSILQCAAYGGNCELISFLIEEKKVCIGHKNDDGFNSLHLALLNGNLDAVKCLISHKADPYVTGGPRKATIFHMAVLGNNVEVLKFINENFPSIVDKVDALGDTALHSSATVNCEPAVRYLKSIRPQWLKTRNKEKKYPYDIAAHEGHLELLELLAVD